MGGDEPGSYNPPVHQFEMTGVVSGIYVAALRATIKVAPTLSPQQLNA
jgi:hypothetical protein